MTLLQDLQSFIEDCCYCPLHTVGNCEASVIGNMCVASQRTALYQVIVMFGLNLYISHKSHSIFSLKLHSYFQKQRRKKNTINQISSYSPHSKFLSIIN